MFLVRENEKDSPKSNMKSHVTASFTIFKMEKENLFEVCCKLPLSDLESI
jgi:hypothetical protein